MALKEQTSLAEPLLGGQQASADSRRGTVVSSILNLTATAMGSGLLTLPYAYAICGPYACTLLLLALAVTSDVTLANLVRVGREARATTFSETLHNVIGNKGKRFFQLVTACVLFLAMTSMQRIIADLLPIFIEEVFGLEAGSVPPVVVVSVINVAITLACLSDTVHGLRFTSGAALVCLLPFTLVIVFRAMLQGSSDGDFGERIMSRHEGMLVASPLLASSLMCHFNILEIDAEMRPRCKKQIYNVIHIVSLLILPTVYTVVGLSGFVLFGYSVAENILVEFQNDRTMQVARGVMSITNALRVPLMALPLRAMLRESFQGEPSASGADKSKPKASEVVPMLACSMLAAFGLERLTKVMGLLGGTCGVLGCFIVPSLLELALPRGDQAVGRRNSKTCVPRPVADCAAVWGLIIGLLVFLATILSWRNQ